MRSDPAEQLRQIPVEVGLEIGECGSRGRRRRVGHGRRESSAQLSEIEAHEADRARVVEHGEQDVASTPRGQLAEKDLATLASMMQAGERRTIQLSADL